MTTITITSRDGTVLGTVSAYATAAPGLVVHRSLDRTGAWYITHQASGARIPQVHGDTRAEAKLYAAVFADLADWTLDREALKASPQWDGLFRRCMDRASYLTFQLATTRSSTGRF